MTIRERIQFNIEHHSNPIDAIMDIIEERDKKLFAEPTEYFESVAQRTERLRIKRLAETLK